MKSKKQKKADAEFIEKIKSLNIGIKSVEIKTCEDCGGEYLHIHGVASVPAPVVQQLAKMDGMIDRLNIAAAGGNPSTN